jgi:GT2 family glycosyltransferase
LITRTAPNILDVGRKQHGRRGVTSIVVIIPTIGRKAVLNRLLGHLEHQERLPDEVVISAPDENDVEPYQPTNYKIRHIFGSRGLCAQRNRAMEYALRKHDIITFFDDDFLPADNYLRYLIQHFDSHPNWSAISGKVVLDGGDSRGVPFEVGVATLEDYRHSGEPGEVVDQPGLYGCNMSVRAAMVGETRFDERLPLYGWQEDIDFTSQLRRHGRVVTVGTLIGVHLGAQGGRASGLRLGYSQVVNPTYLIKKGTMPVRFGLKLMARNLGANIVGSLWPEEWIDRRGRLRGNLLGLRHVFAGRIEPEHITSLPA